MKSAIMKSGRRSSLSWGTSTTRQMDTPRNRCQAIPAHVNGCSNMDTIYRKSAQQVENCEIRTFGGSQSSKMRTKFTMLYRKVKNMRTKTAPWLTLLVFCVVVLAECFLNGRSMRTGQKRSVNMITPTEILTKRTCELFQDWSWSKWYERQRIPSSLSILHQ